MVKEVVFMSEKEACNQPGHPGWAVISITKPEDLPAPLQAGWHAVLRLQFDDTDQEDETLTLFSEQDARVILAFAKQVEDKVDGILVHCHAGISRSAAVAKFLAERYNARYPEHYPLYNKLIYRRLNQAMWQAAYGLTG